MMSGMSSSVNATEHPIATHISTNELVSSTVAMASSDQRRATGRPATFNGATGDFNGRPATSNTVAVVAAHTIKAVLAADAAEKKKHGLLLVRHDPQRCDVAGNTTSKICVQINCFSTRKQAAEGDCDCVLRDRRNNDEKLECCCHGNENSRGHVIVSLRHVIKKIKSLSAVVLLGSSHLRKISLVVSGFSREASGRVRERTAPFERGPCAASIDVSSARIR